MIGFPKKFTDVSEYARFRKKEIIPPANVERFLQTQLKRHEENGFPHKKLEEWRYFPFQKIQKAGYIFSDFPEQKKELKIPSVHPSAITLKIQNGTPILPKASNGFSVFSWKEVLEGKKDLPPEIKSFVFKSLESQREGLCPLNNALGLNGLVILITKPLKQPLEIHYSYHTSQDQSSADNLRNFIFLQEKSQAQIIETFHGNESPESSPVLLNLQTDTFIGKKARLEFIRLDQGKEKDTYLNHFFCEMSPEAKASLFTLSLKSGTSRFLTHLFQKEKSVSEMRGLSLLGEGKYTDHQVTAEHLGEEGISHQFYQSLLFQSARHIFKGMTRIEKPAQKTDARQLNRNLILGERAVAVSAPELDIKADDVKARHGSSTSSLEENRALLFYLQSRGIPLSHALNLLLSSMIKEAFPSLDFKTSPILETLILNHLQSLQPSFLKT